MSCCARSTASCRTLRNGIRSLTTIASRPRAGTTAISSAKTDERSSRDRTPARRPTSSSIACTRSRSPPFPTSPRYTPAAPLGAARDWWRSGRRNGQDHVDDAIAVRRVRGALRRHRPAAPGRDPALPPALPDPPGCAASPAVPRLSRPRCRTAEIIWRWIRPKSVSTGRLRSQPRTQCSSSNPTTAGRRSWRSVRSSRWQSGSCRTSNPPAGGPRAWLQDVSRLLEFAQSYVLTVGDLDATVEAVKAALSEAGTSS